jgi:hypothetical protein
VEPARPCTAGGAFALWLTGGTFNIQCCFRPCTSTRRTLVLERAILRIHFGFGVVEAGAFYVEHVPAARAVVLLSFEVGCNAPIVFVRM